MPPGNLNNLTTKLLNNRLLPRNLRFLMRRMLPAPLAEFLELDFPLDTLPVLARVVIPVAAHRALEPY